MYKKVICDKFISQVVMGSEFHIMRSVDVKTLHSIWLVQFSLSLCQAVKLNKNMEGKQLAIYRLEIQGV